MWVCHVCTHDVLPAPDTNCLTCCCGTPTSRKYLEPHRQQQQQLQAPGMRTPCLQTTQEQRPAQRMLPSWLTAMHSSLTWTCYCQTPPAQPSQCRELLRRGQQHRPGALRLRQPRPQRLCCQSVTRCLQMLTCCLVQTTLKTNPPSVLHHQHHQHPLLQCQ